MGNVLVRALFGSKYQPDKLLSTLINPLRKPPLLLAYLKSIQVIECNDIVGIEGAVDAGTDASQHPGVGIRSGGSARDMNGAYACGAFVVERAASYTAGSCNPCGGNRCSDPFRGREWCRGSWYPGCFRGRSS